MFVPETLSGMELLEHFRASSAQLVFVVDEYGEVQGMITVRDVLEAITGEFGTQTDDDSWAVQRADGSWLFDGLIPAPELKDRLELKELPEEDRGRYNTLAGMIMLLLGRLPDTADWVEWDGWRFEVVDLDGKRVDKVLASALESAAIAHDGAATEEAPHDRADLRTLPVDARDARRVRRAPGGRRRCSTSRPRSRAPGRRGRDPGRPAATRSRSLPGRALRPRGAGRRGAAARAAWRSRSSGGSPRRSRAATPAAPRWVHWGSTSQDVIDTAMVLVTRRALALVDADLGASIGPLLALAQRHVATPVLGRTLMQPAQVVSFGFKVVGWAAPLVRCPRAAARPRRARAAAAARRRGRHAVGRSATQGPAVAPRMAGALGLAARPSARGTRSATTGSRSAASSACCAARSARSRRDWRCSRRPRSASWPSRRARGAAARRRCRTSATRSRR